MEEQSKEKIGNKGILYIATGQKYITEAIQSAQSCKQHNAYPIALITDQLTYDLPEGLFDQILVKPASFNYRDKLLIKYSPFEKTVFIDTDTYIADNLDDLFRILDYREFAIHQADEGYEFNMPEVSNAMPEFNTGVIAFILTPEVKKLIEDWGNSFDIRKDIVTDQFHLRKVLYQSDVKFAIFSSAYNFIIYYPNFVIQRVKILHGRPFESLNLIARDLNKIRHEFAYRRMYYPHNNDFLIMYKNLNNQDAKKMIRFGLRIFLANLIRPFKTLKFTKG